MGVGCTVGFTCHSPFCALWLPFSLLPHGKEKCGGGGALYDFMARNCVYIFIYKKGTEREGLNFASFLVPFSSF